MTRSALILLFGIFAMLAASQAPAHGASPPAQASGEWTYLTTVTGVRQAGCNTFLSFTEQDVFTGTFEGSSNPSTSGGTVALHCNGDVSFNGTLYFDDVAFEGLSGEMVMNVNGRLKAGDTAWTGRWVVLSASGGLDGLHGNGAWYGPGAGGPGLPGELDYDGRVHFHP